MAKTFKKEFIANGLAAHVLKRTKRKNAISFEIRYRRNGYNIYVTASTLEVAKKKFVTATLPENIEKYRNKTTALKVEKNTLKAVALEWLKTKEGKIDARTLRGCFEGRRLFSLRGARCIYKIVSFLKIHF